jgi:hypothetical protein
VRVTFNGYTTSFDAAPGTTGSSECTTAFTALKNVLVASCTKGTTASGGAPYTITFTSWPEYPLENNLHSHSGNPALSSFTCDISSVTGTAPACAITSGNTATDDITEYEFCSGRGICSFGTGLCMCKSGYTGAACNILSNSVVTTDTMDAFTINPTGSAFTGSALKMKTARSASSLFNFLEVRSYP